MPSHDVVPQIVGRAPETTDPIAWIAMFLVFALIGVLFWQLRSGREERRETATSQAKEREDSAARQETALKAFREELAAERAHDRDRANVIHARLDMIKERVAELAARGT